LPFKVQFQPHCEVKVYDLMSVDLLKGQVAIVTGAGRGLGRAAAEALAAAGAAVVLAARTEAEINFVADQIKRRGGLALAISTDVSEATAVDSLITLTIRAFQRIDILVNNAALISPIGRTWEVDPYRWRRLLQVNVIGPFLCARAVLPQMLERGSGRIINVTSGAAQADIVGWSAYCASKAALDRLSGVVAKEVAGTGVVVAGVSPGLVDTDMQVEVRRSTRAAFPRVEDFRQYQANGQLRPPVEPARLIVWLASTYGADQNGAILRLDDDSVRRRLANDLGEPVLAGRDRVLTDDR
jgi:NAD(P)-dependent dehydrogenase (short-subunit alcohol dehydrogenase family)